MKIVTQNGASSYTMSYTSFGSASSFTIGVYQSAAETCRLFGTTLAACTATVAIGVGGISKSTTDTYMITQEALLSYG
ncbi:hypothetical protein LTR09_010591 [Extremus antarcticus]|uniref:Uncharacterized protein n=1 Tax=Extremus antarcticus TaxID=702011 RepID=A0AAJ0DDP2_9PEZI|nr:hypothetical protein LTR09_010591 [Extremus antarcticus]